MKKFAIVAVAALALVVVSVKFATKLRAELMKLPGFQRVL